MLNLSNPVDRAAFFGLDPASSRAKSVEMVLEKVNPELMVDAGVESAGLEF